MSNMKIIKCLLITLFAVFIPFSLEAADIQVDLNGFRLLQFKTAPENTFGKPYKTFKTAYSTVEAYLFDSDAYMIFEYYNDLPNNITSIQLTGHTDKAIPFKGLVLGADVKKVEDALGKPSKIEKIDSPKVSEYSFENTNYSVEIDENNKLYSIKISLTKDINQKHNEPFKAYDELKSLIIKKDINAVIEMLRPDVEIYKNGKILSINKKYTDFVAKPDKKIMSAIFGDKDSVLKEIKETEPEAAMRLIQNMGVGEVYKFYKGSIIKEIVFFPYNGKYRVYEIEFKE